MIPQLEQLEGRVCPTNITYGGGPTIPHIQVVNIHSDPSLTAYTDQATRVAVSQYLPMLERDYGIGAGALIQSIDVSPIPGEALTTADVNNEIAALIASGQVPAPTPSTLYVFFLASGQYVTDEGGLNSAGYHTTFRYNGQQIYDAGIYNVNAVLSSATVSTYVSAWIGHEIAEAASDPIPLSGWVDRVLSGNGEVADIWANSQYQFSLDGFTFFALATPDGSPILPPSSLPSPPTQSQQQSQQATQTHQQQASNAFIDLAALAAMEFRALAFRCLALIDPRDFADDAAAAQEQVSSNPLTPTPWGQAAVRIGDMAFVQTVGG